MKEYIFLRCKTKKGNYKNSIRQWNLCCADLIDPETNKPIVIKSFDVNIISFFKNLESGDHVLAANLKETNYNGRIEYETQKDTILIKVNLLMRVVNLLKEQNKKLDEIINELKKSYI